MDDATDKSSSMAKVRHKVRRRKQLERDLEHITQEMYQRNRELASTNRTLSLLQAIDALALQPETSLEVTCKQIAAAIGNVTSYPLVAILTVATDSLGGLRLQGWSVNDPVLTVLLDSLTSRTATHVHIDRKYLDTASQAEIVSMGDIKVAHLKQALDCSLEEARHIRRQTLVKSLYVSKLIARSRLVGLVVAGLVAEPEAIPSQDTLLLERLSESVGVALDNRLLFEENRRVLAQVRRSNDKLKALDETKDDFISMASHQLRTPLTSIKGYLSMVLEGDAGTLTKRQQKMLQQAFNSSQQMTYLIADLLNLSRLSTGKFVIESVPVDLSRVVQAEVNQLREVARTRGLTLSYDRPYDLTLLMLDEVKIRQVVMNFIDNALHYTPEGGSVTVNLAETPAAIEYTVTDTGIGVPKSAQHKLFSKFYRADNAQKTRPDGTGLGLFMAKKVVTAQGGAVIFRSVEGKGSTFGFRIPKAGHGVS